MKVFFFEKLFLSILEIIGSFRCACPYWCLLASQSQQVSYSCKDNSYDMVHHIQSSLGIVQHIWFVSGQIWSSQGRRATPPPLWDRNHGMKIMESKKQAKKTRDQNMDLIGKKGVPPPSWDKKQAQKLVQVDSLEALCNTL